MNIKLKLLNFSHRIGFIKIVCFEFIIDLRLNIEFDWIVTSSDGLYIEIDIFGFLKTLDVVEVDHSEEIDKDSGARSNQTKDLSVIFFSVISDLAWSLEEQERLFSTLSIWVPVIDEFTRISKIDFAFFISFAGI